jgi:hypothetical protein
MKRIFLALVFIAYGFCAVAQTPTKNSLLYYANQQTGAPSSGSGYGSGITIEIATGLDSAKHNVTRDGTPVSFTLSTPTDYFTSWQIIEANTQTPIASGSGLSGSFTPDFDIETVGGFGALPQGYKSYDLKVITHKDGNYYYRTWPELIGVSPPIAVSFDETWNISVSTPYHDGAGIDRPGYRIRVTGTLTGSGYIALEDYRSSDPSNPIVIYFDDVTLNTSSAWMIQMNKDCQNVILDGAYNPAIEYGFRGTFTGTGSQGIRIQPADTGAGSTLSSAGKNVTLLNLKVDGNRNGGSGININFDTVTGSTIEYYTWSYDNFRIYNCYAFNTTDETYYFGRFNANLVSGFTKPSITNLRFAYNKAEQSGGDGFQFGIIEGGWIHDNIGIDLNWRNATDHRNLFQFVSCRNTWFYKNRLDWNESEGGSTLGNVETGYVGSSLHILSNIFDNRFAGSHANLITIIEDNTRDAICEFNFYNNTVLLNNENSIEIWKRTIGVTQVANPLRIVDNAIFNDNDADEVVYINTPDQTYFTISNFFSQTSSDFDFANFAGDDFRPASLSSNLFGSNTSFIKNHPHANLDVNGYHFESSSPIRGAHSGIPLIIQGAVPDITAPTLNSFTIEDATPSRINFSSSEIITATTTTGFSIASPSKTISSVSINAGQLTGHYFTVSTPFVEADAPTIAYSGGSNLVDASSNALASFGATSITNNISPPLSPINLKVNFFTGSSSGWISTGATSPKPGTNTTQDFGQLGTSGVYLRALNPGPGSNWNATGSGGTITGSNSGIYPDAVLQTYWYIDAANVATFEFYNIPDDAYTFTITLLGNRTVGSARYMNASVNNGTWSSDLDVNNNTLNVLTFTGVTVTSGVIKVSIRCKPGGGPNDTFAYLNGLTLDSE